MSKQASKNTFDIIFIADFISGVTAAGAGEKNRDVPLLATTSIHWLVSRQPTSEVMATQSGSICENVRCCAIRWDRPFTPKRLVRSQSCPLVSSAIRWDSNTPAAKWPTVLHPRIVIVSRQRQNELLDTGPLLSLRLSAICRENASPALPSPHASSIPSVQATHTS